MKSRHLTALVAGASLLALSCSALAQSGATNPEPAAPTVQVPSSNVPLPPSRVARRPAVVPVQVSRSASPCAMFTCRRVVLLGIAY
jgi:hypothetical protein